MTHKIGNPDLLLGKIGAVVHPEHGRVLMPTGVKAKVVGIALGYTNNPDR
jgi:hypothetical protein